MAGRPGGYGHHGYGGPPPPPGHPPHMYPGPPGVMYYPVHPAYFYPYPPPSHHDPVQVVDSPPEDVGPELPGETVELPWSTYRWVPACLSQRSIPPGALRVGTDADGEEIYAGPPHV
ncbi:hypothetical protein MSG28_004813 [Choristoneura fumiferana]|uniref:Uncharacterized protein n=1 Tax=Choristoneura fumiferana TaxID=7141 RepID=A0ACC0K7M7_CHOFU|nr:hypothetical protein MSG28_004813 [Choristoneura fumiferana]